MAASVFADDPAAQSPARVGWRERWWRLRDRLLGDAAFRHAAGRFALTRPLARRQAAALFDLMAGFVYSQVLAACVELRLFERLRRAPLTAAQLAAESSLPLLGAQRLLEAAAALDLVQVRGHDPRCGPHDDPHTGAHTNAQATLAPLYGLGVLGATLAGNDALASLVRHHAALYRDLSDPLALLRAPRGSAELAQVWAYATARSPGALCSDVVAPYSAVMTHSQALIADQVLDAYPVHRHRRLLDVGGGEGAFLAAALARAPGLAGQLFDLPAVAQAAQARLAALGLAQRATVHGGDFKTLAGSNPLPQGADLVSLVRVLYDHDDATALHLLRAVREVLPRGGTVLVAEPMAQAPGARRMGAGYFGIYLLAMGSGRVRSAGEHRALLHAAGFEAARERRAALPLQTGLVTARAP
jgi:demethylspheroidene O-methyltransferase